MEKFSKFRDPATGIAPFQSAKKPLGSDSWAGSVGQKALGGVLFPVVLTALSGFYFALSWIPWLGQAFARLVVLRSLRILYSSFVYEGERRVATRKRKFRRAAPGDVMVSNFVSPLDPLVYAAHQKCVFVFPMETGGFAQLGLLAAVMRALTPRTLTAKSLDIKDIVANAAKRGAVVVFFAEGTTSNGKAILPLVNVDFRALATANTEVYVSAIKYTPGSPASPMPQSLFSYLWRVTTTAWWYMVNIKVSGEPLAKSVVTRDGVGRALSHLARIKQVGDPLGIAAKREYVRAYDKMQGP